MPAWTNQTANTNEILQHLDSEFRPQIEETYGVTWAQGQRQEDQTATEQSMKVGALIALILIYLTLAWIFGSYTWPLFVMLAIPFGIVGAAWGHFILGISIHNHHDFGSNWPLWNRS